MVPLVAAVALVLLVLLVPAMSQSVTVSLIPLVGLSIRNLLTYAVMHSHNATVSYKS